MENIHLCGGAQNFGDAAGQALAQINKMVSAELMDRISYQVRFICLEVSRNVTEGRFVNIEVFIGKYSGDVSWNIYNPGNKWLTDSSTIYGVIRVEGRMPSLPESQNPFKREFYWEAL